MTLRAEGTKIKNWDYYNLETLRRGPVDLSPRAPTRGHSCPGAVVSRQWIGMMKRFLQMLENPKTDLSATRNLCFWEEEHS